MCFEVELRYYCDCVAILLIFRCSRSVHVDDIHDCDDYVNVESLIRQRDCWRHGPLLRGDELSSEDDSESELE